MRAQHLSFAALSCHLVGSPIVLQPCRRPSPIIQSGVVSGREACRPPPLPPPLPLTVTLPCRTFMPPHSRSVAVPTGLVNVHPEGLHGGLGGGCARACAGRRCLRVASSTQHGVVVKRGWVGGGGGGGGIKQVRACVGGSEHGAIGRSGNHVGHRQTGLTFAESLGHIPSRSLV
jgi:hypothetical protein